MEIWAANGPKIDVLGRTRAYFTVDGLDMTADVIVSNDVHEFMLGCDWLVAQGALWNFINKTLSNIRLIHVRERIVITPNTEDRKSVV